MRIHCEAIADVIELVELVNRGLTTSAFRVLPPASPTGDSVRPSLI